MHLMMLGRVNPLVLLQILRSLEGLAAYRTRVGFEWRMD